MKNTKIVVIRTPIRLEAKLTEKLKLKHTAKVTAKLKLKHTA